MKRLLLIILLPSANMFAQNAILFTQNANLFAPGVNVMVIGRFEAINPWIPVWKAVKWVEIGNLPDTTINRDEWAYGPGQIRRAKLEDYNNAQGSGRRAQGKKYTLQDCLREEVAREIFMWHCCQYRDIETAVKRWNGSGEMAEVYWEKVYSVISNQYGNQR